MYALPKYLLKKIVLIFLSFLVICTLTFMLMKLLPGDPFQEEQTLPKEIYESLQRHYGLDQPWYIQYGSYIKSVLQGNFGPSFKYQDRTVNSIIAETFPVSALLGLEALFIAITLGVILGSISALKENQWQDYAILLFTTLGISIPSFILASLLQYIFALKLQLFPLARWESFSHTILPALALAAMPTAFITKLIRSGMIDVLQSPYIQATKAKGLSPFQIFYRHALRNTFLPVLTYLGQLTANILVGSFVIEKIFSLPGLGQWFVNSVSNRDYTVIMGLTIFYSIILLTMIFLVDIAYKILDPRIQTYKR